MAVTIKNEYTGDGSTVLFSFTFPYISTEDIRVTLDETPTTEYTFANVTTIEFDTPPANGVDIVIYRDTQTDSIENVFYPGSAVRAKDLNDNFTQSLYVIQEADLNVADANQNADDALANSIIAIDTANDADAKADQAVADADQAKQDAAQAAQDAQDAKDAAEAAENAAEAAGDVGLLFDADPGSGSATSGSNKVPITFQEGLKLPDENSAFNENNAIRINTSNEKLEVRIDDDWTTASAGAEVADSPPTPATQGDVWWDPSDGRGYVYYTDDDSSQWVEMNPSWNGSVQDGVVTPDKLSQGGPSWDTSGNLTVDGIIDLGDLDNGPGVNIYPTGAIGVRQDSSGAAFEIFNGGTAISNRPIRLFADGSASFAGSVDIGDSYVTLNKGFSGFTALGAGASKVLGINDNTGTERISFTGEGSATFGSGYKVGITPFDSTNADQFYIDQSDGNRVFSILGGGDVVCADKTIRLATGSGHGYIQIKDSNDDVNIALVGQDGSATFAGTIESGDQSGSAGVIAGPSGYVHVRKDGGTNAIAVWNGAAEQPSAGINPDGSATFAGTMQLTGLTTTSSLTYPAGWVSAGQYLALNTSSARYKRDIETADPSLCLDIVNKLRPVWYRSSIETDNPDESYWGFLAEEVAEVEPRLTAYDAEGLPGSVDYGRFTPVLTSVLQQALSRIEALEAEVRTLKGGPVTADIPEGGTN